MKKLTNNNTNIIEITIFVTKDFQDIYSKAETI